MNSSVDAFNSKIRALVDSANVSRALLNSMPEWNTKILPQIDMWAIIPNLDIINGINLQVSRLISDLNKQMAPIQTILKDAAVRDAKCKRLEAAGWLPHEASPWHLLDDDNLHGDSLSAAVEIYYTENWSSVRYSFERALSNLSIDEESKATFHETLTAHELGLFRCVPRTLFPEIERLSRIVIHDGAMDRIASQPGLQEAISNLCPSDLNQDGISGMRLYKKLIGHLYVSMPTAEKVAEIAAEPVPNRHAAIHGYVSYNTIRHSLNALIVTEYLFRAIDVIATQFDEQSGLAEVE